MECTGYGHTKITQLEGSAQHTGLKDSLLLLSTRIRPPAHDGSQAFVCGQDTGRWA